MVTIMMPKDDAIVLAEATEIMESLHTDHAWIGKMLLVFPSVNEACL